MVSPSPVSESVFNVRFTADEPLVLGVSSRVAGRLGASVAVVRLAFGLLTIAIGVGLVVYLLLAALMAGRVEPERRPVTLSHNLGVVALTAALLLVVDGLVSALPGLLLWPVGLMLFAVVLANPDTANGAHGEDATSGRNAAIGRVAAGLVLMVSGLAAALAGTNDLDDVWRSAVAALVLLAGVGLVMAPWVRSILASADDDRRERIRAEERSDIAAHLHDSVLQTLTLIQNRADDQQLTAALAHQQERELRRYLYGSSEVGADGAATFKGALEGAAAEVEDQYLKIIECIVVGDAGMDDSASATIGAAREAMVNAAKFADIPMISVYAEVNDDSLVVYVRDRGIGFELALVPEDRHGVSDSIYGRVQRLGGEATIRTAPGDGTEVRIEMPR